MTVADQLKFQTLPTGGASNGHTPPPATMPQWKSSLNSTTARWKTILIFSDDGGAGFEAILAAGIYALTDKGAVGNGSSSFHLWRLNPFARMARPLPTPPSYTSMKSATGKKLTATCGCEPGTCRDLPDDLRP
ncbi:MAG: hypothetical protein AB7O59_08005 [Pirellulales bacterium]